MNDQSHFIDEKTKAYNSYSIDQDNTYVMTELGLELGLLPLCLV